MWCIGSSREISACEQATTRRSVVQIGDVTCLLVFCLYKQVRLDTAAMVHRIMP